MFDEIDAGIGGHTARAVGEHLRALAEGRQILCITHLPQVAAMAARHFTIVKDSSAVPARTTVSALDGNEVVGELVRMLGAAEGDRAASRHARQLLRRLIGPAQGPARKASSWFAFSRRLRVSGVGATFRSSEPHYTREASRCPQARRDSSS